MRTVLFLCTGNFYRSRFAEILFNARAQAAGLEWRATSRALALEKGVGVNFGAVSVFTVLALEERGIAMQKEVRSPMQATTEDFFGANLVVAVKEAEHRPLMEERYPKFAGKVEYWHVHDLDAAGPREALAEIEGHVTSLVKRLSA